MNWFGTVFVEYGTTYPQQTCSACFANGGHSHVPASWEAVDSHDNRMPLCTYHADEARRELEPKPVRAIQVDARQG